MKRIISIIFTLFLIINSVYSQSVGVVLSGGGAKGIAHIGVLQALEENGIPIDYISGTSMGAIVGGFYAMGYSPKEILELIKSKDFTNWMNGTVEDRYIDYFRIPDPTPEILSTSISLSDTSFTTGKMLPTSLMNPVQMNFAFLQLCSQATAQCGGDFNKLFIPYRSVASDVNERKQYVFRNGDVGDAIRASMTFPFVFKAIKVNGHLLYDGGIYNNYPADVMINDFNPDKLIGCVVVAHHEKTPQDYDMVAQLQNMIVQPSKYNIPENKGVQLDLDLSGVSLLEFYKADSVYMVGYEGAMAKMDSIKKVIKRRVDPLAVQLRRYNFKSQAPILKFSGIEVHGVTDDQKEYILKVLRHSDKRFYTLEEIKIGYFKLLADKKITEIIPHAIYDKESDTFRLILDVEMENSISISIGANLSSTISNQLYFGAGYQVLDKFHQRYNAEAYIGKVLNAISLNSVFYFTGQTPQYLSTELSNLNYNFFQGEKLFYKDDRPAFIMQHEYFLKFRYGIPALKNGKLEFGLGGGILSDRYMQTKLESFTEKSFDKSLYSLFNGSIRFEQNNLNAKQYPVSGRRNYLTSQFISGDENFQYPDSVGQVSKVDKHLSWIQLSGGFENYHEIKENFILGTKGEAVFNNKRALDNYTASILQAPAFTPTLHSKAIFNEAYRSNQYAAFGVIPIYKLENSLWLRTELYGFLPLSTMKRGSDQNVVISHSFSNAQYIAEASLVYELPFTTLSLFINNYSYPKGDWNIGINLGYLIFRKKFIE